jgi:hypothetical protein
MWILLLAAAAAAQEEPRKAPEKAPGFLGVQIGPVDAEHRAAYGIPEAVAEGAVIVAAIEGAPAAKAGLKPGDVLVRFAGAPVRTPDELRDLVRACFAGDEVAYVLRRGDGTIDGRLVLGSAPAAPPKEVPIEERLDRVQRDIEELDRRLRRGPRTLGEWRRAEERKAGEARGRGDLEAVRRAEIRLELLREMEAEGVGGTDLERFERMIDRILERLGER